MVREHPLVVLHHTLRRRLFYPLMAASIAAVGLLTARYLYSGKLAYGFFVWNLFLAWIPFGAAMTASWLRQTQLLSPRRGRIACLALAGIWLAFLPNAPYLVTDLVHLFRTQRHAFWYDLAVFLMFAWIGCVLGLMSLRQMHLTVQARFGHAIGWAFVCASAGMCGFGVYLGRFVRLNSWDVLTDPLSVATAIFGPFLHPIDYRAAHAFSALFALFVLACYLTFPGQPRRLRRVGV